ncbi:hypothetical protein PTTG_25241 [Puccinia triticina 1-1 BBBD Race 1]|uniref:Uncharacterized protein n=1 Tax=Puccinia triticina (isolate 1-1 / race 1 (BBBD)) TaxID=630390 RepID=A0A180H5E6_PUCT1|nr:hypothetical protein PTTG_25241 [Puccinia triticina 1-1 BBBD Race 1]WAR53006.1 hypothetical protein PtB15_2B434 [Puccinia triticina]
MSSEKPKKPLSKLQRRIQAGLAGASSTSASSIQPKTTTTGESGPMEIVETTLRAGVDSPSSLARDFSFLPTPPSLFAPPSKFANALPRPDRQSNQSFFSLPKDLFLQPCLPNAFDGPSPDDEVLIARQGSSLAQFLITGFAILPSRKRNPTLTTAHVIAHLTPRPPALMYWLPLEQVHYTAHAPERQLRLCKPNLLMRNRLRNRTSHTEVNSNAKRNHLLRLDDRIRESRGETMNQGRQSNRGYFKSTNFGDSPALSLPLVLEITDEDPMPRYCRKQINMGWLEPG